MVEQPSIPSLDRPVEMLVWPNPNRGDRVSISLLNLNEQADRVGIELFDLTGKRILDQVAIATQGSLNTNIELGHVNSGVYLLRVSVGDVIRTERVVVQH